MLNQYLATAQPEWRLVFEEEPPKNVTLHLLTHQGICIKGLWAGPDNDIVAWRELPKLTSEQKRRLVAIQAAGLNPAKHHSKQF